ncbi:hypothetical protein EWI07_14100 [Sporolactobacillus sp. THM7-4]|nr:hypothetical protein EWI07_14100 [Sporolactobacillus sp. THM7-4]
MQINQVNLFAGDLTEMIDFYADHLGFKLKENNRDRMTVRIGTSLLTFLKQEMRIKPVYHFALTIPGSLFVSAKQWIKTKVTLNKEGNEDEVFFKFLNARSFYFNDPAGNIVEFIARENCLSDKKSFSIDDVTGISEINLTVKDVLRAGQLLNKQGYYPLKNEQLNERTLNFIGDFHAYFLLGPTHRTWFFSNKASVISPLTIDLDDGITVQVDQEGKLAVVRA